MKWNCDEVTHVKLNLNPPLYVYIFANNFISFKLSFMLRIDVSIFFTLARCVGEESWYLTKHVKPGRICAHVPGEEPLDLYASTILVHLHAFELSVTSYFQWTDIHYCKRPSWNMPLGTWFAQYVEDQLVAYIYFLLFGRIGVFDIFPVVILKFIDWL